MKRAVQSSILSAVLTEVMDFRAGRCSSLALSKSLSYLRLFVHYHTLLVVITLFCAVLKTVTFLYCYN